MSVWSCKVKKDGMLETPVGVYIPFSQSLLLMRIIVQQEYWVRDSLAKVFCCGAYDAVVSVLVPLILMNAQVESATDDYFGHFICVLHATYVYARTLHYQKMFSEQKLLSFVIASQLLVSHNSCTCYCTCTPFLIMFTTQIHEILSE